MKQIIENERLTLYLDPNDLSYFDVKKDKYYECYTLTICLKSGQTITHKFLTDEEVKTIVQRLK